MSFDATTETADVYQDQDIIVQGTSSKSFSHYNFMDRTEYTVLAEDHPVHSLVCEIATKAGVRKPLNILSFKEKKISAFIAYYHSGLICSLYISSGAIDTASLLVLRGIIGHEISHVVYHLKERKKQKSSSSQQIFMSFLLFRLLCLPFKVIFHLLRMKESEYRADEGSARIEGKEACLAMLELGLDEFNKSFPLLDRFPEVIKKPILALVDEVYHMLSTHPSFRKRIKNIVNLQV